jgi:hypothetical protein
MLNPSLPLDIWTAIATFLERLDLYSLLTTNKEIHSMVDQDVICEQFAQRKFPLYLLDLSLYENSWKMLLQDDNAKNGYYRLQVNAVSFSQIRNSDEMFYVNIIRSIAWDRKENLIILEFEAFGENLRAASTIDFFRVNPSLLLALILPSFSIPLVKSRCENYAHSGPSHQLCRIYLDATQFIPGYTYKFAYSGSHMFRGSDYHCFSFLAGRDFRSLPELFEMPSLQERLKELTTMMRSSGYNGPIDADFVERQRRDIASGKTIQQSGNCDFVSRSTPLRPSNVFEWKGVPLPQRLQECMGGCSTTSI